MGAVNELWWCSATNKLVHDLNHESFVIFQAFTSRCKARAELDWKPHLFAIVGLRFGTEQS